MHLWQKNKYVKKQRDESRKLVDKAEQQAVESIDKIVQASGLNNQEAMELVTELSAVRRVSSNIWDMPLPYGKWESFPDLEGDPPAKIRGFWLESASKLIGVKMPKGSKYLLHDHPWVEILVGVKGSIEVEVNGTVHTVGPNDVLRIESSTPHAVAHVKEDAEFICIWGIPKTF